MKQTTPYRGLTAAEVEASRQRHGSNVLTPPRREPAWRQLARKFQDPLIVILLVVGALSIGLATTEHLVLGAGTDVFYEPVGIFVAILLATLLAFVFEQRAGHEFDLLNQVNDEEPVEVVRDGVFCQVARRDVVVGDVVSLHTGDEVPADGQLLEATALSIDESALTGEPLCHKHAGPAREGDADATFPHDAVLRGTKVMDGHGLMTVTAVGDQTEHGHVYQAVGIDQGVTTPLNEQLDRLGALIAKASYGVAALVVLFRIANYFVLGHHALDVSFGSYLLNTIMLAVTLIVVAVPEGLPMAITLSLAYSMRRMLKTKNLVRQMHACETMGAVTVVCTDKTGTLTQNRMRVVDQLTGHADADAQARFWEGLAMNTTAHLDLTDAQHPQPLGNPTEGALLLWMAERSGTLPERWRGCEVVAQLPFSTEHKLMATAYRSGLTGEVVSFVKGAPEVVMALCDGMAEGLDPEVVRQKLDHYQQKAIRTLAFAAGKGVAPVARGDLSGGGLTLLGVVGIADPVRSDVPEAVGKCLAAGIDVKIVTGDMPGTAREIGRQIGLSGLDGDAVVTGQELERMTDEELQRRARRLKIVARARPMDKKRLVEALQANREVVAVTGDGTNDAPALRKAHVGLSMGAGTSVAKEASDITIIDNSFASIERAVMWGRSLYRNIQRFVLFQLTVNIVACLSVLCCSFFQEESPLTVTQMLWVNLIMDTFAAMALASLPPTQSVMQERPRQRDANIISGAVGVSIVATGLFFFAVLFGLLLFFNGHQVEQLATMWQAPPEAVRTLSPYELTVFFTMFILMQFWNLFNARAFATHRSALQLRGCRGFLTIAAVVLAGQVAIVYCGGRVFGVVPLPVADFVRVLAVSSLVLWVPEGVRLLRRRRKG